ncbi:MAG: exopolysaccharide biosynthesis protein [Pseudomonadota bacterium]
MSAAPEPIGAVFRRLAEGPAEERVSVAELVAVLDGRVYGLALLLLAAPNLTPGPSMPGFSTVFGVPMVLVAAQMMLGRKALWLPGRLARIGLKRGRLAAVLKRATPLFERIERVLKPRWPRVATAERWIGFACLVQAVMLVFPIPVFSLIPAFAVVVTALGLLAKDGLAIAAGLVGGLAALGAFGFALWAAAEAVGLG